MGWVCCWVLWSVHIKSSPMYVTSQFWKSEQVCSGGGPKEPAQLHSLLNVGIQNGLSLLREDIKLQRCWSVLPLPLCHLSETSKLSSPGWHPGWWYPALLRLSPGKRGQRAVAPCDLLLLPSAGSVLLMKKHLFLQAEDLGKGQTCESSGSRQSWHQADVALEGMSSCRAGVSVLCVWKDPNTFWQKGCELTVQSGGFPVLFALPFSAALMLVSLTLQAQLYSSEAVHLADLTIPCQPYFSGFFLSSSHLSVACQYIRCITKMGVRSASGPGCLLPSSFYLASFNICESMRCPW